MSAELESGGGVGLIMSPATSSKVEKKRDEYRDGEEGALCLVTFIRSP